MQLQTIVYVTDMDRSVRFYEHLGFSVSYRGGSVWTAFGGSDGSLALHLASDLPAPGRVTVSLVADRPLESVIGELSEVGISAGPIEEQPFGRSTIVHDPDGLVIQINEHGS